MLEIKNLHVKLEEEDKAILKGVDLTVERRQVHAIMGPNGSGKSTLSYVLAGREGYEVTEGRPRWRGPTCWRWSPRSARRRGCSSPSSTRSRSPGVGNMTFLRTAVNAQRKARGEDEMSAAEFLKLVREKAKALKIDADMLKRPVNTGFSGGEKKRNEILQMAMLEPKMCILDETDSGLDVDAMKLVADGVNALRDAGRGVPRHHPLPAAAGPYPPRRGAHHGRRPDREDRRAGTGARGREERLCRHPGGGGVMAAPQARSRPRRGAAGALRLPCRAGGWARGGARGRAGAAAGAWACPGGATNTGASPTPTR
jgi:Fe-S cluster assembly ATP-binding protein